MMIRETLKHNDKSRNTRTRAHNKGAEYGAGEGKTW
jgi:hypothetical protein